MTKHAGDAQGETGHDGGHSNDDHPVEGHADPVVFQGFVPPGVFAVLRELCAKAGRAQGDPARRAIDELERRLTRVDTWARLALLAVSGERQAVRDLLALVPGPPQESVRARAESEDPHASHAHAGGPTLECPDEATRTVVFLGDRILEAALGFVVAHGADLTARKNTLEGLRAHLVPAMTLVERVHSRALLARSSDRDPSAVFDLLRAFDRACARGDALSGSVHCSEHVDAILGAVSQLGPELAESLFLDQDPERLTQRIASVSVERAEGKLRAHVMPRPTTPFPPTVPPNMLALCAPSASEAKIERWSAAGVTLALPDGAAPGPIWFSREFAMPKESALAKLGKMLVGHISSPKKVQILTASPRRLSIVCDHGENVASFLIPPNLRRFSITNARGEAIGKEPTVAGERIVVQWDVASSDPETSVTLTTTAGSMQVPMAGRTWIDEGESGVVTIVARNGAGTIRHGAEVLFARRLRFEAPFACLPPRGSRRLPIVTFASGALVGFVVVERDADGHLRATAEGAPAVPMLRVDVVNEGAPGRPATIVVSAPGYQAVSIDVWIERPLGLWENGPVLDGVAVHMALLKTGKVLTFSARHSDFHSMHKADSFVWNPATNAVTPATFRVREHINLFCSGHCLLADGRVLAAGGHSAAFESTAQEIHTFNPDTETWHKHAQMRHWRWYPTVTALPDGRALILSGSRSLVGRPVSSLFWEINNDVEVFEPVGNTTEFFDFAFEAIDRQAMYPHMFPLPAGRMFVHLFDTTRIYDRQTPPWLSPPPRSFATVERVIRTDRGYVTCVMLPLGSDERRRVRFFIAGGCEAAAVSHIDSHTPASRGAEIFEYDADAPDASGWRLVPETLPARRFMSDGVLLPDETVLIVNGAERGTNDDSSLPVFEPVIFDPASSGRAFERMEPSDPSHPRLYHGTALLLPDGRVLVGGHTHDYNPHPYQRNDFQLQLFSPPYLFRGPRPIITWAPPVVSHGAMFDIETPDAGSISAVTFIRCSSVTHQLNTDQRCFRLRIADRTATTLRVEAPVDPTLGLRGYYMLFLLSARVGDCGRVPSVARIVQLA